MYVMGLWFVGVKQKIAENDLFIPVISTLSGKFTHCF